jgi:hypothetical protein
MKYFLIAFILLTCGSLAAQPYADLNKMEIEHTSCLKESDVLTCQSRFYWSVKDLEVAAYRDASGLLKEAEYEKLRAEEEKWRISADKLCDATMQAYKTKHPDSDPLKPANAAERKDAIALFKKCADYTTARIKKLATIINKGI